MSPPLCPKCHTPPTYTVECLTGLAEIRWNDDGSIEYVGETDIDWDSQFTYHDRNGDIAYHCGNCHEEFVAPAPVGFVASDANDEDDDIVVLPSLCFGFGPEQKGLPS